MLAENPKGVTITDVINTPVVVNIPSSPSIGVNKSVVITDNGDGVTGIGDIARYTITVQNTGNITLNNVTVSETLTDISGNALTLDNGPCSLDRIRTQRKGFSSQRRLLHILRSI